VGGGGIGGQPPLIPRATQTLHDYSGIAASLARLAPIMTDADTARNLRWQQDVAGDKTKNKVWKVEATSLPGLQFYAYMQPGNPFLVVGHSLSTIYSTTTDVASLHGKIILFTGDRKTTRDCIPVMLPVKSAFEWKKCAVSDDPISLCDWYADTPANYGKPWQPSLQSLPTVNFTVPRMIAIPLRAAKIYYNISGGVMPHELLQALKLHLSSDETELNNGDDWGMVQKWLLVAAQTDDANPTKSHIAFSTGALLSNDELIHCWIGDRLDSTLGRRPDPLVAGASSLGFQGDMATVRNMSGIIATEVGHGLGAVMQQATKAGTPLVGGTSTSEDAKPYNQDQLAALLGFHNVKNVQYLQKVWRQFKAQKTPN
jgi:hypothetical protein